MDTESAAVMAYVFPVHRKPRRYAPQRVSSMPLSSVTDRVCCICNDQRGITGQKFFVAYHALGSAGVMK
jgi:hypothetical protein